jgi:lipopolysaccharide transport system ATP-binding protein
VNARGLSKRFKRYEHQRARTLKQHLIRGLKRSRVVDQLWALDGVDVDVQPGRMLGVIGHNGSGKSTLLRIIGGVMRPDSGKVATTGRLSGLLELNTGMHQELTGRENVLIGGVIAGLTRQEVIRRFDEIVGFAELEEFIDSPVRTYSTGMKMRLGFAVAIHTEPEVLLIDEVLSVGDMAFQAKCLDRIRQLREQGCAILLITHDLLQVEKLCDDVLWLDHGRVAGRGTPEIVVGQYRTAMGRQTRERTRAELPDTLASSGVVLRANENRFGSLELEIEDVRIESPPGHHVEEIAAGRPLRITFRYKGKSPLLPIVVASIGTAGGEQLVDLNSLIDGVAIPPTGSGVSVQLDMDRLDLVPGEYFVNVGLYHPNWDYAFDYHWAAYPLQIVGVVKPPGVVAPPRQWLIARK